MKNLHTTILDAINSVLLKKWTATPAIVQSFNPETKRVTVLPSPKMKMADGTFRSQQIMSNIPVMFNGGGGFTVFSPLKKGDAVLLVFARRGISYFKQTFEEENPSAGLMDINSAIAIPCFGSLSITPSEGLSLQKDNGRVKVEVLNDSVVMRTEGGTMTLGADGNVLCSGIVTASDFVTASTAYNTHKHAGDSGGTTGVPQ